MSRVNFQSIVLLIFLASATFYCHEAFAQNTDMPGSDSASKKTDTTNDNSVVSEKEPSKTRIEIHLITIGPGDHFYTRGGHAAIMVAEIPESGQPKTIVYNYGDTFWENSTMELDFLLGRLTFFLGSYGDLRDTLQVYAIGQKRSAYRQKLNVSDEIAQKIKKRLEWEILPENREYTYHHLEQICSTRIRNLLDEYLNGELERQLSKHIAKKSVREYGKIAASQKIGAFVFLSDLFFGRLHDDQISIYYASFMPDYMREWYPKVMIPPPFGNNDSQVVPLAEPPVELSLRVPPEPRFRSPVTEIVFGIFMLLMLIIAYLAWRKLPEKPRFTGIWLFAFAFLSGIIGLGIVFLRMFSAVPELSINELILTFWVTDLLLIIPAVRMIRGHAKVSKITKYYLYLKLACLVLVLGAHAFGLLYQRPLFIPISALICAGIATLLLRRTDLAKTKV